MSYEKINFKNREVEKPLTFKKHVNDDGTITLEPKPGTIVEEGTPLLADHFNHMDDGIYKAHEEIDNLKLSGIERNKELVANLNSKKVSATTNDSLKTNIAKVKDIKLGSGNAVTSDVLEGKTFSSSSGTDLTGTMSNNGILSKTITTQGGKQKINQGYYEGGEIKAQLDNLVPENIKNGVNIGGVVGSMPTMYYNHPSLSSMYWLDKDMVATMRDLNLKVYRLYTPENIKSAKFVFEAPSYSSRNATPRFTATPSIGDVFPIYRVKFDLAGDPSVFVRFRIHGRELDTGWIVSSSSNMDIFKNYYEEPLNFIVGETYEVQIYNINYTPNNSDYIFLRHINLYSPTLELIPAEINVIK